MMHRRRWRARWNARFQTGFLLDALPLARRTRTLKAFYKHDGAVSSAKCAPSHTVGETEARWPPASHTQLPVAPHMSNLIASTHTWKCRTRAHLRSRRPLQVLGASAGGGERYTCKRRPGWGGRVWVKRRRGRREAGGKDNVHVSGSRADGSAAAEEDSGSPSPLQGGNDWKLQLSPCSP